MHRKFLSVLTALVLLASFVGTLSASSGTLDPGTPPGTTASYTLEDIYARLNNGTAGVQQTGFTEPNTGPGSGTMHTLNDIMGKAPALDPSNGASADRVLTGKTFWGLTAGQWGVMSGTMPDNGGVVIMPSTSSQAIAAGYHNGSGYVVGDAHLTSGNILSGVKLFGVTGSLIGATGTASPAAVLTGTTFSNASQAGLSGTMPDNGGVVITPTTSSQTIALGYHNGSGYVVGDTHLTSGNILNGVKLFGVMGSVIQATGSATPAAVLTGTTFSNGTQAGLSGAMPDNGGVVITPTTSSQAIALGYHNGSGYVVGDANLVSAHIVAGKTIFGTVGTYPLGAVIKTTGQTTTTEAGVAWPNPRFTDDGHGAIRDNATGLVWLRDANCAQTKVDWPTAQSYVATLNSTGYMNGFDCQVTSNGGGNQSNWRLPTRRELESLQDYAYTDPPLPNTAGTGQAAEGDPFVNTPANGLGGSCLGPYWYWTSTLAAPAPMTSAWKVGMGAGLIDQDPETALNCVWPVRDGP